MTVTFFIMVKNKTKYLKTSIGELPNKLWHIYTLEYHTDITIIIRVLAVGLADVQLREKGKIWRPIYIDPFLLTKNSPARLAQ